MGSRRWGQWLKRSSEEANATSGVVAILGGAVTAAGVAFAAPVAAGMGGAVMAGAAVWCAWKGFPARASTPAEKVGASLSLREVEALDPPVARIGFVGASRVGKTTLLAHMAVRVPTTPRTDRVTATIIGSQTAPQRYCALVDGAGQEYTQQFSVIGFSRVLLIFVDHNESSSDVSVDDARLTQHREFVDQVRSHIAANHLSIDHVHFVLNKSDLWVAGPDSARLRTWFDAMVADWVRLGLSTTTKAEHSNFHPHEVTALVRELFRHVS